MVLRKENDFIRNAELCDFIRNAVVRDIVTDSLHESLVCAQ